MRYTFAVALVCVVAAVAVVGHVGGSAIASIRAGAGPAKTARGLYLATVMGCSDCHTPLKMTPTGPEPDATRLLSGHPEQIGALPRSTPHGAWPVSAAATNTAFSGPWGVSYAANLTPDQNTGLGIWTEEMFIQALRTGKHMGTSRLIAPPMPWPAYRHATDEDLQAIYAYLRSLPPIPNHVPDYQPPVESASERN